MRRRCCCGDNGCLYKPYPGTYSCNLPRRNLTLTTAFGAFTLKYISNPYFDGWYSVLDWEVPIGNCNFSTSNNPYNCYGGGGTRCDRCSGVGDGGTMRWLVRIHCSGVGQGQAAGGKIICCVGGESKPTDYRDGDLTWGGLAVDAGLPTWTQRWAQDFMGTTYPAGYWQREMNFNADGPPTCSPLLYPIKTNLGSVDLYGGDGKMTITE